MIGRRILLVAILSATLAPAAAAAQTGTPAGWTVEPASASGGGGRSFFDYTLAPGEAVQDYVKLSNLSDQARTFVIYASDAYTTQQGAFALRTRDQPRGGLSSWVSLPFTTRTVPAATSVTFPFQLGIPREAAPGDWAGGIVAVEVDDAAATDASDAPARSSSGVRIEHGVAARVYARVKGPLHPALTVTKLDIDSSGGAWAPFASGGRVSVSYDVTNSGNVRLTGSVSVEITDLFGKTVARLDAHQLPDLLPNDQTSVTETWEGAPLIGFRYRARVIVDAGGVITTRSTGPVWHLSVPVIALALALVALARWLMVRAVRFARQRSSRSKELVVA
jgi:hypothetical protein